MRRVRRNSRKTVRIASAAAAAFSAALLAPAARADTASYNTAGSIYAPNFATLSTNVTPITVDSNNPDFLDAMTDSAGNPLAPSSSFAGWSVYAASALKYAVGTPSGTTGSLYDFQTTSTNQVLGFISTSSTGIETLGVELVNNTGSSLNSINISYALQLWWQNVSGGKTLDFGFYVDNTPSDTLQTVVGDMSADTSSTPGAFGNTASNLADTFTTASAGNNGSAGPFSSVSLSDIDLSLGTQWNSGSALFLMWQTSSSAGTSQGLGINDLSFSASEVAPGPPPNTDTWNANSDLWDTTSSNWTDTPSGGTTFTNGDSAVFNTPSADSTITIAAGGVSPSSTTFNNSAAHSYTVTGGPISGNGFVDIDGAGTVTFNSSNGYPGGTFLNNGILVIGSTGSDASLGASGGAINFNGGTLQIDTSITDSSRILNVESNGGFFNTNSQNFITSGGAAIAGNFTKSGYGNLEIDGSIAFTGAPTLFILGGTLDLGGTKTVSIPDGATINGNLIISGLSRVNFDGGSDTGSTPPNVASTPGLYAGTGSIEVTNPGTYADDSSGNLNLANGVGLSNASGDIGGDIQVPIVLNPNNLPFTKGDVTQAIFVPGTFTVTIGGSKGLGGTSDAGGLILEQPISGNSDVNISNSASSIGGGAGYVDLDAQSTYTGTTLINAGGADIILGAVNALPITTDVIVGTDPTGDGRPFFDLNGWNQTISSLSDGLYESPIVNVQYLTITNNSAANGATLTIRGSDTPANPFSGYLTDGINGQTLSLAKSGSGTLELDNSESYTGNTTVTGGTLELLANPNINEGTVGSLGDTNVTVANGATFLAGNKTFIGENAGGTLTLNPGSTLSLADGMVGQFNINSTLPGAFSGTTAFSLNSADLVLDMDNSGGNSVDQVVVGAGGAVISGINTVRINVLGDASALSAGVYTFLSVPGGITGSGSFVFSYTHAAGEVVTAGGNWYKLAFNDPAASESFTLSNVSNPLLVTTASAPVSGYGNQLPGEELPGLVNNNINGGSGDGANYLAFGGFNPTSDTEIFALKLVGKDSGVAAHYLDPSNSTDAAALATIADDIDASLGGGIIATALPADGFQGQFTGYDILFTLTDPDFLSGYLDWNFSGYTDGNISDVAVTDVAAVPEPATFVLLSGPVLLLMSRRRRRRELTAS